MHVQKISTYSKIDRAKKGSVVSNPNFTSKISSDRFVSSEKAKEILTVTGTSILSAIALKLYKKEKNTADYENEILNMKNNSNSALRFDDKENVSELAEILKNSPEAYNNFQYAANLKNDDNTYRFNKIDDLLNITKALTDNNKAELVKKVLNIKTENGNYRFNDFQDISSYENVDNNQNFEMIEGFAKVKNLQKNDYALNVDDIFCLLNKYKKALKPEQMPIPATVRKSVGEMDFAYEMLERIYSEMAGVGSYFYGFSEPLTYSEKIGVKNYFSQIENSGQFNHYFDIEKNQKMLDDFLLPKIPSIKISNVEKVEFAKYFMSRNNEDKIRNADFAQFGKNGLPLKYSRKDYIEDLNKILDTVDLKTQNILLKKMGITLTEDKKGYNGIINLYSLDDSIETEKKLLEISKSFIKNNEIKTGSKDFDDMMNALIKGMPEFINVIGKQQHASQDFSVDIHTLQVLKESLNHSEYYSLSDLDKTVLKMTILLHDLAKSEGFVDKKHQDVSAMFSKGILEKYNLPSDLNNHITLMIKNHHWLENYNTGKETPEGISIKFKYPNDYKMSKIMAYADLKSVSDRVFNALKYSLSEEKQKILEDIDLKNKKSGQLLYTTDVVFNDRIPQESYKGRNYRILDFTKYNDNDDMGQLGFVPGTKKSDLRFLVHMSDIKNNLDIIDFLSDVLNTNLLSQSFISCSHKASYYNNRFGVILKSNNTDMVNAYKENQASGRKKDGEDAINLITNPRYNHYRMHLPDLIANELWISNTSYGSIYSKIASRKYLGQIKDDEKFILPEKTLTGKEIKEAIIKSQDSLLKSNDIPNEVISMNPAVKGFAAKVNDISEIPDEFLNFVYSKNLPIYLFGED